MWVIDIRHWLNDEQTGPGAPKLRLKVEKLAEIITYATARDRDLVTGIRQNAGDVQTANHALAG